MGDAEESGAWLTIEESARYLSVSERTIHRWADEGLLLAHQLRSGGGRRFRRQDLDELVAPEGGLYARRLHDFRQQAAIAGHLLEGGRQGEAYAQFHCPNCGGQWYIGPDQTGSTRADGLAWTVLCGTKLDRLPSAYEVVARFQQWEAAASMSPNRRVAESAPLGAPTVEQAAQMMPRLAEFRDRLAKDGFDWHGRLVSQPHEAALGQLWEEWRDFLLGVRNGYREVWNTPSGIGTRPRQ